jgi:hypothetical protein
MSTHEPNKELTTDEYKYWAFISYNHHDEEAAKWLHNALETYKIPHSLIGRELAVGKLPARLYPIFRDKDELPSSNNLSDKIKDALYRSRFLIVICSPYAVASRWVNEEIKTFKSFGREARVHCFIIDGEPNASDVPERSALECFPPAVRHKLGADLQPGAERVEPLAADARKGQDSRANAKLRLLAGLFGLTYDDLWQRERRRRARQRARLSIGLTLLTLLLSSALFIVLADAGVNVPFGERTRTFIDRHRLSVLRPVHTEAEVRQAAAAQRRLLLGTIQQGQEAPNGLIFDSLRERKGASVWVTAQTLTGVFHLPDLHNEESSKLVAALDAAFQPAQTFEKDGVKYGWLQSDGTLSPALVPLWTAAALAETLGRPGLLTGAARERAQAQFVYTQEVLKLYRANDAGGWNMFPRQINNAPSNYPTALALLMLLETRQANLAWEGSTERRDALLKATAQWLIEQYDDKTNPAGWKEENRSTYEAFDGLTLQIYAELLRAEEEAGISLPPKILNQIPRHLNSCNTRTFNYALASTSYQAAIKDYNGNQAVDVSESLAFLWRPWAIDCAARWLRRAKRYGVADEAQVPVQRALGHLVIDLGDEAMRRATGGWTYEAGETLYGLAAIPPP